MKTIRVVLALLFVVAVLVLGRSESAYAALSSSVTTKDGHTLVALSNPYVQLTFEPDLGGRCTSFRFLDNNEELAGKDSIGMFMDHWAKYAWPSGLYWLPYQYEILKDGDKRIGIREWVTVPAKGGGKGSGDKASSAAIDTSPELVGLVVNKTIWLNNDNDLIEVDHEIKNPTNESKSVALYVQHNLILAGSNYSDIWYMPSTQGVQLKILPQKEGDKGSGPDWILEPTAGWLAVRDQKTNRGLVFVFDYNYLIKTYSCGSTAEWFFESVPVAPGKSFATTYYIKPEYNFQDFAYASKNLAVDIRGKEEGKKVRISLDLAAVSRKLSGVSLDVSVIGWKTKQSLAGKTFTIDQIGFQKETREFILTPPALTDGILIKVTAKGQDFSEKFERYYAGDTWEREHRTNYFATKGGALVGAQGDAYYLKQPRKVKRFDKPDFAKINKPNPNKFTCLAVFGLYTNILNLDDALSAWKYQGKYPVDFSFVNCPPNGIEKFPGSYEELFAYNTVILSDVNSKALGDIGLEMLCDYVQQGGNLLLTGGPYALGNGEFDGTRFQDILPVTLAGPFDLKWAGKDTSWPLQPAKDSLPLLKGVTFDDKPQVFWNHRVKPKPETQTILLAGDQPALVLGRYGQGKIAILTLSPTGKEKEGEVAWWSWKGWPSLMQNIFSWFAE